MKRCFLTCIAMLVLGCGSQEATGSGGAADTGGTGGVGGADMCATLTCECDVDEDCANHEVCVSQVDGRFCLCAAAYVDTATGCEFGGAPLSPGFGDSTAWMVAGGSVLDPGAPGDPNDGQVTWQAETVCTGSVSQTFTMPPYARAEPLALQLTYLATDNDDETSDPDVLVSVGGRWLVFRDSDGVRTESQCLGDAGFGGDVEFQIRPSHSRCPGAVTGSSRVVVERLEVVKATDVELDCGDPGTVTDGDFEGDGSSWGASFQEGRSFAGVQDGIGANGSRAGTVQTQEQCQGPSLRGRASWPLSSSLESPALRVVSRGTVGREMTVRFGQPADRVALLGTENETTTLVCIPPAQQGLSVDLFFLLNTVSGLCATPDARDFVFDSLEVISEIECGSDPYLIDGDFELGLSGTVSSGWNLSGSRGGSATIIAGDAQSGNASLEMLALAACSSAFAGTTIVTPRPDANGGPAVKFFHRLNDNPASTTTVQPGGVLPEGNADFVEYIQCLDPARAMQPLPISFSMRGPSGTCGTPSPNERAVFDNVRVTTDPACPTE